MGGSKRFGSPRGLPSQIRLGGMMRIFSFILLLLLTIESEGGIYPKSVLQSPRFLVLSGGITDWDGGNSTGLDASFSFLRKSGLTSRIELSAYIDFDEYDIYSEYQKTVSDSTIYPSFGGAVDLSDDTQLGESGLYWAYNIGLHYRFASGDLEVPSTGQMLSVTRHSLGLGFYSDLNFPINFPDNSMSVAPYIGFGSAVGQSYSDITNLETDKSVSGLEDFGFSTALHFGIEARILNLSYIRFGRRNPLNKDRVPSIYFSVFRPFIF